MRVSAGVGDGSSRYFVLCKRARPVCFVFICFLCDEFSGVIFFFCLCDLVLFQCFSPSQQQHQRERERQRENCYAHTSIYNTHIYIAV